jgi:pyrroloquinoline quinone biosynthesis protein B
MLLNCSPAIAAQIEAFPPLQPRATRDTPIAGMLLTDANVDHLGGLAVLRQSGPHAFVVRSTLTVREIAVRQPAFSRFAQPPHRWIAVAPNEPCEAAEDQLVAREFDVCAIPVPGTTPGYAQREALSGAVVAYEIRDRLNAKRLLFAPVFSAIDDRLRAAVENADVAFLDGSFFSDDELIAGGLMNKTARGLGHQPVGGPDGTLARLQGTRCSVIFTHINNSNPMLDPDSEAAEHVRGFGARVAFDGMELVL